MTPDLPSAGFDLTSYATAIGEELAMVITAVLSVSLAFLVIRRGWRALHTFDGKKPRM